MRKKILEKLDAEYECFFNDMLRTSKENLFAQAEEIALKKKVQVCLRTMIKSSECFEDEEFANKLLLSNNLMDICYRYASDHPDIDTKSACENILFSL